MAENNKAQKAEAAKKAAAAKKAEAAKNEKTTWTITTPVEGFTGVSMGIAFTDGVGETDNEWLVQRCKESGYKVK